jgi:hypothetical protein
MVIVRADAMQAAPHAIAAALSVSSLFIFVLPFL